MLLVSSAALAVALVTLACLSLVLAFTVENEWWWWSMAVSAPIIIAFASIWTSVRSAGWPSPQPLNRRNYPMVSETNVTLLAALAALGTIIATPLVFLLGMDQIVVRGIVISLVITGLISLAFDVGFNVISGLMNQTSPGLNALDKWTSRLRLASATVTLLGVLILLFYFEDRTVAAVMAKQGAWILLIGIFLWSCIDVFGIQRVKDRGLLAATASGAAAPTGGAPRARPAPEPYTVDQDDVHLERTGLDVAFRVHPVMMPWRRAGQEGSVTVRVRVPRNEAEETAAAEPAAPTAEPTAVPARTPTPPAPAAAPAAVATAAPTPPAPAAAATATPTPTAPAAAPTAATAPAAPAPAPAAPVAAQAPAAGPATTT